MRTSHGPDLVNVDGPVHNHIRIGVNHNRIYTILLGTGRLVGVHTTFPSLASVAR